MHLEFFEIVCRVVLRCHEPFGTPHKYNSRSFFANNYVRTNICEGRLFPYTSH